MKDLGQQKMSFLHSELNETRDRIRLTKDYGYDNIRIEFAIWLPFKIYILIIALIFISLGFYEELIGKNTQLHKYVRKQLGHHDLHNFLATESINQEMPYDDEIPECDYETMTAKRFFNDYVKQNRPCLFKGYAKLQKAYELWNNETYLIEQAGDEIIYAERQRDNRFAYFTDGAKRVYLRYSDFL